MADPQPDEALDAHDLRTVAAYRLGLVAQAAGWLGLAATWPFRGLSPIGWPEVALVFGAGLSTASLHLYDKRLRWFLAVCAWCGGVLVLVDEHPLFTGFGLGLVGVVASGLALKERFCFRIPGQGLMPWVLVVGFLARALGQGMVAAGCMAVAGALAVILAATKLRQPIGHDVGDRSRYEV